MSIFPTLVFLLALGWVVVDSSDAVGRYPVHMTKPNIVVNRFSRSVTVDSEPNNTALTDDRDIDIFDDFYIMDYIDFGLIISMIKDWFKFYIKYGSEITYGYCLADDYFQIGERIAEAEEEAEYGRRTRRKAVENSQIDPTSQYSQNLDFQSNYAGSQNSGLPISTIRNTTDNMWSPSVPIIANDDWRNVQAKRTEISRQDPDEPKIWKLIGKFMYWKKTVGLIVQKIGFLKCTFQYLLVRFWKWVAS